MSSFHRRAATTFTRRIRVLVVLSAVALPSLFNQSAIAGGKPERDLAPDKVAADLIIVRSAPGQLDLVKTELRRRGADVTKTLPIINALAVRVGSGRRADVAEIAGVTDIASDAELNPVVGTNSEAKRSEDRASTEKRTEAKRAEDSKNDGRATDVQNNDGQNIEADEDQRDLADRKAESEAADASRDPGSIESIARVTGVRALWKKGFTGRGVDVALIDTGIAPVAGAPMMVNGVDLSADAANASVRFLDGYGHGTHMAGIIAGHDPSITDPRRANGAFVGIAPGSRVVNVKVGAMDGSVHTSQVVAGIDWVVQNSRANGMNIRVINLSYGSPATSDWRGDPLAWASEVAWRRGVLVVAAAGNEGAGHELSSPAYSPLVLAVGATEVETSRGGRGDYNVTAFTSTGTRRRPDIYVPGSHVISLRVKGSFIDAVLAKANVSDQLTRGTGTSQATAVASGIGALLFEAFPNATPDQIKALLTAGTQKDRGERDELTGLESSLDAQKAWRLGVRRMPNVVADDPFVSCGATWCRGAGDGANPGLVSWAQSSWNGTAWNGAAWNGAAWNGASWNGSAWSGAAWNGAAWNGAAWNSSGWLGASWNGASWNGASWNGAAWNGAAWNGAAWNGSAWSSIWTT